MLCASVPDGVPDYCQPGSRSSLPGVAQAMLSCQSLGCSFTKVSEASCPSLVSAV